MKERPILFSAPMVRAILDGRKTQTRRIVKTSVAPWLLDPAHGWDDAYVLDPENELVARCPFGAPGDRLWVKETWQAWRCVSAEADEWEAITKAVRGDLTLKEWFAENGEQPVEYRATSETVGPWTPAIFMQRWASRITLEVTDVRVERLQAITEEDARAEGFPLPGPQPTKLRVTHPDGRVESSQVETVFFDARGNFCALWEGINGRGSWDANPWVWIVGFRRLP